MRYGAFLSALLIVGVVIQCGKDDPGPQGGSGGETFEVTEYPPVAVGKAVDTKVFVHMMPWFEDKTSNNGRWGQHWTMATQNPDVIVDVASGRRAIASHFYPLIGPYASGDEDVIEYQLLLMKLAGIDGILIDWYGTIDLYDYKANLQNAEKIIALTEKVGLSYAIVYEDQVINNAFNAGAITEKLTAGMNDMSYLSSSYFTDANYIKLGGKPLLLTFGPQTFQNEASWTSLFSTFVSKPAFFTLWYESGEAGVNATGEYSWVYQNDAMTHLEHLEAFYNRSFSGLEIYSAYPGFKDFYKQGGWGDGYFLIDHEGTATFQATLGLALDHDVSYLQLVTWNDYGEGTMIEPTVEFGYGFLTALQTSLGVELRQEELELVADLFAARRQKTTSLAQKKLDQVFYLIVSLQLDEARSLLDTI